jgi:hypothetical protein
MTLPCGKPQSLGSLHGTLPGGRWVSNRNYRTFYLNLKINCTKYEDRLYSILIDQLIIFLEESP